MRAIAILGLPILVLTLAACGASPPAPVTPAQLPVSPPPPAEPPAPTLPEEPAGLVAIAKPAEVCTITGALSSGALELGPGEETPALVGALAGQGKVTVGPGAVAYAEVLTSSLTVRGLVRRADRFLRTTGWVSFGGVYFPGTSAPLVIRDARDGNLVVEAPSIEGFTLDEAARTIELPCSGATLEKDPDGVLARELPPLFAPKGKASPMFIKAKTRLPVSADAAGPALGAFDAADQQREVTLLEQRGARSRIRRGRVAGWVDTKLLVAPKKDPRRTLQDLAQFNMIGFLNSGEGAAAAKEKQEESTNLVCPTDVRVVAEVTTSDASKHRYVAGVISAGKPVRIADRSGAELAYLAPVSTSELMVGKGARLAVPARDLSKCTVDASPRATSVAAASEAKEKYDAIALLEPASAGREGWGTATGDAFGARGLGLADGVAGEGIGLGNIGTIGHGAGTGQGFGNGHGRLGGSGMVTPSIRQGATQVTGRLPPEVVQRIVRQHFGRFRLCYEHGLITSPQLTGRVSVKFVIDEKGAVKSAGDGGSDLPDTGVVNCVVRGFSNMSFPPPEAGIVTVVYPVFFSPGTPAAPPPAKKP
jgi:hypothetical protein